MWWLAAAGVALQLFGQHKQNMAEAEQEQANSDYYRREAEYARYAAIRTAGISTQDYTSRYSIQSSKYAQGNVDLSSGAAQTTIGATFSQLTQELWAIEEKGSMEYDLAMARSRGASGRSSMLKDPTFNLIQGASIGIRGAAGFLQAQSYGGSTRSTTNKFGDVPTSRSNGYVE
jgi:hypothetical protein